MSICAAAGQRHPLSDIPPPLKGVETTYWLPEYPLFQFPAGALVRRAAPVLM